MSSLIGVVLGGVIAVFGFVVMRNPITLARLAPGLRGYYQRLTLDTPSRNSLRVFGLLVCLFGLVIGTAALGGLVKSGALTSISDGFLALLGVLFFAAWGVGIVLSVARLARGRAADWWQMWRTGAALGEIDVYPPVTSKMEREANVFTMLFCALVGVTVIAALLSRA